DLHALGDAAAAGRGLAARVAGEGRGRPDGAAARATRVEAAALEDAHHEVVVTGRRRLKGHDRAVVADYGGVVERELVPVDVGPGVDGGVQRADIVSAIVDRGDGLRRRDGIVRLEAVRGRRARGADADAAGARRAQTVARAGV